MSLDASLPDLVLVHGWGSGPFVWSALIPELAREFNVIVPPLPGYGAGGGFPRRADALAEWLRDRTPPGATWMAWSAGALAALYLARGTEPHIARLNLVSGVVRFTAAPDWPHGASPRVLEEFRAGLADDPGVLMRRFARLVMYPDGRRDALDDYVAAVLETGVDAVDLQAGLELLSDSDARSWLSGIAIPMVWFHGDRDRVVPCDSSRVASRMVAAGRMCSLPDTGHAPFLTHPEVFLQRFHEQANY